MQIDYSENPKFEDLLGKTITKIQVDDKYSIYFETLEGKKYLMEHSQDCCESVSIEDIVGDLEDLLNSPILMAEESNSDEAGKNEWAESYTWTFYRLATVKGYVTIRWYGESNGYYSEGVDFMKLK